MASSRKQDSAVTDKDFRNLLHAEITSSDKLGIWLTVDGAPYFVPYEKMQWLRDPAVRRMLNMNLPNGFHLRWDSLDLDIDVDAL